MDFVCEGEKSPKVTYGANLKGLVKIKKEGNTVSIETETFSLAFKENKIYVVHKTYTN